MPVLFFLRKVTCTENQKIYIQLMQSLQAQQTFMTQGLHELETFSSKVCWWGDWDDKMT